MKIRGFMYNVLKPFTLQEYDEHGNVVESEVDDTGYTLCVMMEGEEILRISIAKVTLFNKIDFEIGENGLITSLDEIEANCKYLGEI